MPAPVDIPDAITMSRTSFDGYLTVTVSRVLPPSSVKLDVTTETASGKSSKISVKTQRSGGMTSRVLAVESGFTTRMAVHEPPGAPRTRSISHTGTE